MDTIQWTLSNGHYPMDTIQWTLSNGHYPMSSDAGIPTSDANEIISSERTSAK